ncbi:MAG: GNAT family N-acetyltransferase [Bacteriovoracia bacterium]
MYRFLLFLVLCFLFVLEFRVHANADQWNDDPNCKSLVEIVHKKNLKIVRLTKKKVPALVELLKRQFSYDDANFLYGQLERHFNQSAEREYPYWILVARNGAVVGGFGLTPHFIRSPWWIDWMVIHPNYRGNRIGHAMMKALLATAKKMGADSLTVYTSSAQEEAAANHLYQKFGFRVTRQYPEKLSDGRMVEGIWYERSL